MTTQTRKSPLVPVLMMLACWAGWNLWHQQQLIADKRQMLSEAAEPKAGRTLGPSRSSAPTR